MEIIKSELTLGVEKPFTFLQTTDTHFCLTDEKEPDRRRAFARDRWQLFRHGEENAAFIRQYVTKTGYPLAGL